MHANKTLDALRDAINYAAPGSKHIVIIKIDGIRDYPGDLPFTVQVDGHPRVDGKDLADTISKALEEARNT